jgi:L-alanine-DL-glutamate epimerase-like enolase superfamily enzyme/predicted Na+-dependent transporter
MGLSLVLGLALVAVVFTGHRTLKGLAFTVWVFAFVAAAMNYPAAFGTWFGFDLKNLIVPLIQIIMFGMGTTLSLADFTRVLAMPWPVIVGILLQYTVMPFVGFGLARLFGFEAEIAAGVVLIGSAPGGVASNVINYLARCNVALSVTMTAISTLISPVMTPLMMRMLAGQYVQVSVVRMMIDICNMIVVPILAGLIAHWILHGRPAFLRRAVPLAGLALGAAAAATLAAALPAAWTGSLRGGLILGSALLATVALAKLVMDVMIGGTGAWMDRALPVVSMAGICCIIAVITARSSDDLRRVGPALLAATAVHNLIGYLLGYWGARAAAQRRRRPDGSGRGRDAEWRHGLRFGDEHPAQRQGRPRCRDFRAVAEHLRLNPRLLVAVPAASGSRGPTPSGMSRCQHEHGTRMNRRQALRALGLGAVAGATGYAERDTAQAAEEVRGRVNTRSEPSQLKITDLRVAPMFGHFRSHLVRLETNQGLVGYGEVRDGASPTYALLLKSRLIGENPCHVDRVFRKLKQFGGHGRQAGGVVAVEMACWDLAGKAWGVPCWQMLGGKFRDRVRVYADTPTHRDPAEMGRRLRGRRERGFTFLKMDIGINLLRDVDGALSYPHGGGVEPFRQTNAPLALNVRHPFTGIRVTDKGLAALQDYVRQVRDIAGWDVPIAADHFGHVGVEDAIKLAQAMDPFNLAWLEDLIPWDYPDDYVRLRNACRTPLATGEDIYLKEGFQTLFEKRAIAICHPDLATAGGLLETKKIGDLAMDHGISMALHMAGSPFLLFASAHCAAATENFLVLECHDADTPTYDDFVEGVPKPLVGRDGFVTVPDGPGLGLTLNEAAVKEALRRNGQEPEKLFFPPTEEWNKERSHDRTWSFERTGRPAPRPEPTPTAIEPVT